MARKATTAKTQKKSAAPQGGISENEWSRLETVGDVKRLLRWIILETKSGKMETKTAATLGQISCYLLRTMEVDDLSPRIARLEKLLAGQGVPVTVSAVAADGTGKEEVL